VWAKLDKATKETRAKELAKHFELKNEVQKSSTS
jgi:hypothetical protein